jgi:hypothetical protein
MPLPFTFDDRLHICRLMDGSFVPSVTQVMSAQGLSFNFQRYVQPDALDRCRALGTDVHALTDTLDQDGEIPDTWLTEQTAGYVESWRGFKRISGFVPSEWSVRMCEAINGFPLTGELDKYGMIGRYPAIVDIKTGARDDTHGVQTAAYEMLRFRSAKIGRLIRGVAQLFEDGSPGKLIEYPENSPMDGLSYADTFLSALQNVHYRLRRGRLSERDFISE